ncbi:hypothetical protein Gotur_033230 [Gossypium turneri]
MSLQHFSHQHPLVFTESQGHEIEKVYCFGCGELVSGSSFGCVECGFYLHKQCAEAPAEMDHPFHRNHNLNLLTRNPYEIGTGTCDFCRKPCENFVYYCSCNLDFHIKCALFSHSIAEKRNVEFQDIPRIDPSINTGNVTEELKKAEFKDSLARFVKNPNVQDLFIVVQLANLSFISNVPQYLPKSISLSIANILLFFKMSMNVSLAKYAKKPPNLMMSCIFVQFASLSFILVPRIIKFFRHQHSIFHTYFIERREHGTWECRVCLEEVNTKHGSYFCSKCNYIVHVKCATKNSRWYYEVDSTETEEETESDEPVDLREIVADTWIKHLWHHHNLTLSGDFKDFKQCDGCLLPIDTPYYYCSQCDFFVHKACAELPVKKHIWFHFCQRLHKLTSGRIFQYIKDMNIFTTLLFSTIKSSVVLVLNIVLMYILSNSLITRMMTIIQKVIIVIFVKEKGTPNIGFIIVQLVTLQLIPNVFFKNIHSSSLEPSTQENVIHILSLLSKRLSFIQNVTDVANTALICPFNVRQLDAAILFTGSVDEVEKEQGVCK